VDHSGNPDSGPASNAGASEAKPNLKFDTGLPGLSIMDALRAVGGARMNSFPAPLTPFQEKVARDHHAKTGPPRFPENVGLGPSHFLNRESGTLSGGEAQRIRPATQIGAG
jgi:hypothetical protein